MGPKSIEFLRYLGWLKPWFGVGGVVKITVSVERGFSRFETPFEWFFLIRKWYQSYHVADFGGPRGTHGGYLEQGEILSIFDDVQGPSRIESTWSEEGNPRVCGAL